MRRVESLRVIVMAMVVAGISERGWAQASRPVQTGAEQIKTLLRYASEEAGKADLFVPMDDFGPIAMAQGMIKDLDGLAKTAALIEKLMVKEPGLADEACAALANAYACAGERKTAEGYFGKVKKDGLKPLVAARFFALLKDAAGAEAALAGLKPAERVTALAKIVPEVWGVDRATAEELLRRAKVLAGKELWDVSVAYAKVGDIKTACTMALPLKNQYCWRNIVDACVERQDFEAAKLAAAGYLVLMLQSGALDQRMARFEIFEIEMAVYEGEKAAPTAQALVRETLAELAANKTDWEYQTTSAAEAAEAAARVGDDALVKAVLTAAAKIPMPDDKVKESKGQVIGWMTGGQARRLLLTGKTAEAIALARSIDDKEWQESAQQDLLNDAIRGGDLPAAMKIYDSVESSVQRHMSLAEPVARALAIRYLETKPLEGKAVDFFDWIGLLDEPEERSRTAAVIAGELIRRGG